MTREEAKELLPIIQAFAEGKSIECSRDGKFWSKIDTPNWRCSIYYRIKPEPEYRPFKTQEECWEEMLKHQPFGWVRNKCTKILYQIDTISGTVCFYRQPVSYPDIFDNWEFIDGTPFGVKIE